MTRVTVQCYSGYRADERPVRFKLGERTFEVEEVEDRWYSPGADYFRLRADDGNIYILRRDQPLDEWSLEAYRARRPIS
jgi:hypothetical protein